MGGKKRALNVLLCTFSFSFKTLLAAAPGTNKTTVIYRCSQSYRTLVAAYASTRDVLGISIRKSKIHSSEVFYKSFLLEQPDNVFCILNFISLCHQQTLKTSFQ